MAIFISIVGWSMTRWIVWSMIMMQVSFIIFDVIAERFDGSVTSWAKQRDCYIFCEVYGQNSACGRFCSSVCWDNNAHLQWMHRVAFSFEGVAQLQILQLPHISFSSFIGVVYCTGNCKTSNLAWYWQKFQIHCICTTLRLVMMSNYYDA